MPTPDVSKRTPSPRLSPDGNPSSPSVPRCPANIPTSDIQHPFNYLSTDRIPLPEHPPPNTPRYSHTTKETHRPPELLPSTEEVERLCRSDQQRQAGDEEDLRVHSGIDQHFAVVRKGREGDVRSLALVMLHRRTARHLSTRRQLTYTWEGRGRTEEHEEHAE